MSERIALDYTQGEARPIPSSTWTDIDPAAVIDLALDNIPASKRSRVTNATGLQALAALVEPRLSDDLRERIREATGHAYPPNTT